VIVLLTPHIVKDDVAMNALSEEELKKAEQLRVGTRRGMMWFGRERLAESAYESAKREMTKEHPNRKTALWHLDSAINLNPKMLEAIEMKQELTGKEVTGTDGSSVRYYVRKAILEDVANPSATRPSTRPADVTLSSGTPARPATQPAVAEAPTTQPLTTADAGSPTTQPTVADAEILHGYLEEVESEVAAAPATQPAPTAVVELPTEEVEGDFDGFEHESK
jgi:hypothetical protein